MTASILFRALLVIVTVTTVARGQSVEPVSEPVAISVLQFGAGNVFRPGEIAGIEVELTSSLPADETVWVQWDHETSDGDLVAIGRPVTISPGQPRRTWLYVPLPPRLGTDTECRILVRRYADGIPGQQLGSLRFTPATSRPREMTVETGLLGIVGSQAVGVDAYERPLEFKPGYFVSSEPTAVRILDTPAALPDRWMGLRPYEAIIWSSDQVSLSLAQENAMLEWLRRGGHLVVILPQAGNPWELGRGEDGPLGSILPIERPTTASVPIGDLLAGMMKNPQTSDIEENLPVQVLRSGTRDVIPAADGWVSTWALPGVGTIAAKRSVGHGQLTLLGVDAGAPRLRSVALARTTAGSPRTDRLPETDVFWNGLLGRRSDSPSPASTQALVDDRGLVSIDPRVRTVTDSLILDELADSRQVGGNLLFTVVLFLLYWLIAIPIGWTLLKYRRQLQWTWLLFLGTTVVFAGLAWLTANAFRTSNITVRHLTVLDHVHGENLQRGISWMSIFTPGYGDYEVRLEGDEDNLVSPWEPTRVGVSGFPDTRETLIDLEQSADRMTIPSRATTTFIEADWRGPIATSDWGDLLRMDPTRPLRILRNAQGEAVAMQGALVSRLPAPLIDTQIMLVDQAWAEPRQLDLRNDELQPWIRPSQSGRMERRGWAWALPGPVDPDLQIDLSTLSFSDASFDLENSMKTRYSDSVKDDIGTALLPLDGRQRRRSLEALSFYHQLEPPAWIRPAGTTKDPQWSVTRRQIGRSLDRSGWMSRPALIVTGFLLESELPIPLRIEGDRPDASTGLVMVRWIYPIPDPTSSPPAENG